ncbi:hypothetical protein D0907_08385 [Pseudoalteromonas lipolytica]|uniref:Uncharacterized protein n=1 Tax=Pseudoalteromonas lipolytica TaxID=570156 RepID=A0AAD0RZB1_9GAMM|nr:hypothetical protein [Pseudoalteromonas donghaensis]AXV65284.1 hypothetical protein D0907_08385 [Pseudoalteromonas donghaensis]
MPAFTAEQASINNGSKVVQINSGESVANIRSGDFLVLAGFIVEINRAFVGAANEQLIELVQAWSHSTQSNQSCIVIPTTAEFKTVVAALNEANMLVNNNYKAMQDWQTKTGTVTFSNKDGTTTTVKTLKQIEADNAAQLEAYHPYPWAMRKVEFEARRAANNENFAASGFVHFGKHYDNGSSELKVAEGLYTRIDTANNLRLGRVSSTSQGLSKTNHPFINVSGVVTKIEYLSREDSIFNQVKLPPAEDGTRTYDNATGLSVTHATSAIAFASETATNKVVTDRVDMFGFEPFLREINDADPFVYKYGLPQSLATSIKGVPTESDTVRPITYFAWYEGDTTSRGKGVNWQTATEAQRIAIASDLENNIYFDDATGKFYQWCVRGRSFAGLGNGDWYSIDANVPNSLSSGILGFGNNLTNARVDPIGHKDNPVGSLGSYFFSQTVGSWAEDKGETGLFTVRQYSAPNSAVAVNGECYFLVCGTINRLNKGGFHPSFNPLGASSYVADTSQNPRPWNHQNVKGAGLLTSKAACFDFGTTVGQVSETTGFIGNTQGVYGSGREDGRYYDAIYANGQGGVCRDMRYKASEITDFDFFKADKDIKAGKYRGLELIPLTRVYDFAIISPDSTSGTYPNLSYTIEKLYNNIKELEDGEYYYVYNKSTGELFDSRTVDLLLTSSTRRHLYYPTSWGSSVDVAVIYYELTQTTVSYSYTASDIIGNPVNILQCTDLSKGWIGRWVPLIPDGTSKEFKLRAPVLSKVSVNYTTDGGATWITYPSWTSLAIFDDITNSWTGSFLGNAVYISNYKAIAKITKNVENDLIYGGVQGLGSMIFASSRARDETARGLGYSLINEVVTSNNISSVGVDQSYLSLKAVQFGDALEKLIGFSQLLGSHEDLSLAPPTNNSPAFKTLNYNVVRNQQGFINYAYTGLTYDSIAGDWGDDSKIHIASNQTTIPDQNGNENLIGTACCVESLGWIKK